MTEQEKISILEEIMDMDEGTLYLDVQLNELDEWDSLSKLSLISEAKDRLGKTLTVNEIKEFKTVGDICNYF